MRGALENEVEGQRKKGSPKMKAKKVGEESILI